MPRSTGHTRTPDGLDGTEPTLERRHWQLIFDALQRRLTPGQKLEVWLFGSRARGSHQPYSDVDLMLVAEPALARDQLRQIAEDLEESELPYKVDLVSEPSVNPSWRRAIEQEKQWLTELIG